MHGAQSPNHPYLLQTARRVANCPNPRILDFGCGTGFFVAWARERGADVVGADTYDRHWADWGAEIYPGAREHVSQVQDGILPFADASIDVVIANQVFEHVPPAALRPALCEIHRVLRPGGAFIALFPTSDVWFEGHCGLYFPQRLRRWPALQGAYLRLCHRLGLGYYRNNSSPAEWAADQQRQLATVIFHHTWASVRALWKSVFGSEPSSLAVDNMRFRISHSPFLRRLSPLIGKPTDALLTFACHKRAGRVLLVKAASPSPQAP